ncbi:hypothetical protein G1H11_14275 [Phytoactinopolyspora alkaliphila]|uniref:Uncharacterized protein n=1 Tax=Phytoactinopolyspora alkaliphila TaxID=1783498 RepID=A0A6N9YNA3_9ACTN|nr:hypothetical protein [Phytoactinopolyspora alkaliphila]NED96473.1 hypothetical protein [Phytoactinopolyspora alkaliphila]
MADAIAEARRRKAEGQANSVAVLSDNSKARFDEIVADAIKTGEPFSLDDLREQLDLAQIPNRARGGLIQRAIKRGWIEHIGYRPSAHAATHRKPINVYRGVSR